MMLCISRISYGKKEKRSTFPRDLCKRYVVVTPYNIVGYVQIPDGRGHNDTRERSSRVSLWPRPSGVCTWSTILYGVSYLYHSLRFFIIFYYYSNIGSLLAFKQYGASELVFIHVQCTSWISKMTFYPRQRLIILHFFSKKLIVIMTRSTSHCYIFISYSLIFQLIVSIFASKN